VASERPIGRAGGGSLLRSFAFIAARWSRRSAWKLSARRRDPSQQVASLLRLPLIAPEAFGNDPISFEAKTELDGLPDRPVSSWPQRRCCNRWSGQAPALPAFEAGKGRQKEAACKSARPRPKSSKTPVASSQRGMNGKPSACQCCSRQRSAAHSTQGIGSCGCAVLPATPRSPSICGRSTAIPSRRLPVSFQRCRAVRIGRAPFAELVRLSDKSVADELHDEHTRQVLGE
jgi:hypothetical protein